MSQKLLGLRTRNLKGDAGITYVRCRVCGDHRRVISGRHLSKHEIDRETYLEEYRLSPDELIAKEFRVIQSSRKGYQAYGKPDWVASLKKVYKKDSNVFAGYLQKKYRHIYLQGVWIYGDWDKALHAAGFAPEKMRRRGLWDEEKINAKIRAMHKNQLPLYAKYLMDNHATIFSAAMRRYGSWARALVAAGVTQKLRTKKLYRGRASLLNALSDVLYGQSKNEVPQPLKREAEHYFGSLKKAITELQKEKKRTPGWNKEKIARTLSRMHRSKENLTYALMRREHPALLSAAEARFGGWGKALYAAGIDPNLYFVHHTWRKRKLS
jgi:hypothetical protein